MDTAKHEDVVAAFKAWSERKGLDGVTLVVSGVVGGRYAVRVDATPGIPESYPFGKRDRVGASLIKKMRED